MCGEEASHDSDQGGDCSESENGGEKWQVGMLGAMYNGPQDNVLEKYIPRPWKVDVTGTCRNDHHGDGGRKDIGGSHKLIHDCRHRSGGGGGCLWNSDLAPESNVRDHPKK